MPEIAWCSCFGWVGVEIFFVISGLVIANSAHWASPRQFAVGRFLRLYPTAWCAAVFSYPVFLWSIGSRGHSILPLFLSLVLLHAPFLASAYWTLPIELSFYSLILLMLVFRAFRYIERFSIVLILLDAPYLLALWLSARGIIHWRLLDFEFGAGNMLLLRHGIFFGLGILIWLHKEGRLSRAGMCAGVLAIVLSFAEIYSRSVEFYLEFTRSNVTPHLAWRHLGLTANLAFCLGFGAILLSIKFNHLFPSGIKTRYFVRTLGLTTYPFYLLHQRVGGFAIDRTTRIGVGHIPSLLIALAATEAISLLIALYCEPALRSLLRKLMPGLRTVQPIRLVSQPEKG